jgi:predicted amidohydrolase YtcJ
MAERGALAPDLVLARGRVLTMDVNDSVAQAVAIRDGRIVAVGSDDEVLRLASSGTEVIDLDGRTALPGLTDCHVHLASDAGRGVAAAECRDFYDPAVSSVVDVVTRLHEWSESTPPGQWVIGRGSPLQDFRLEERRLPNREELDAALPRHPAYVSFGAHVLVANTLALRERGVTRDTPDPQGGMVVKDTRTGEPTGEFRERAQYLIKTMDSGRPPAELAERIAIELEHCSRRGVTGIHDIIVSNEEVLAYQILAREGRLPVRVQMLLRVIESAFQKWSLRDLGFVQGFGSEWLRIGGIKMSIDGGFTGKNAAFREPIVSHDGEDHPGLIRIQQDELDETVEAYHRQGMRICVHAIGDVALDMILEAYEKAQHKFPRTDHRHRVEHMGNWMMDPARIARAKALGILPMANPPFLFFLGDPLVEMLERRVTEQGFQFRSLWDAGFPLAFGSDAPGYFPVDPLRDLGTTVAHQTLSGANINGGEALTMAEALRSQTVNAAYTAFQERALGSLQVGKLADVAVLGDDPFSFPPERFHHLPVDVTIAGGKVVHSGGGSTNGAGGVRRMQVAGGGAGCCCIH